MGFPGKRTDPGKCEGSLDAVTSPHLCTCLLPQRLNPNPKGLNLCVLLGQPLLPVPSKGGKRGGFCQVLVNNLQHPKTREPSPSRQCHDVVPSSRNFSSPFPLSFLPVGALNPIPAAWGRGGICFTRGVSTSVNKPLVESHLSRSSQNNLICPKGKQNAIFPLPSENPQTSGAPRVSCGILEFSFSMRGRGEGGRGFAIDPHVPFACFLSSIPKKRDKAGDGWRLDVLLPAEHPSRAALPISILPRSRGSLPGFPVGRCMFCALQRDSPQIWVPVPESHGSCWCCERGVPPPTATQVSPPSLPGREQQWEAIPVIFKILCTFWGGSWGSLPPFPRNF